MVDWTYPSPRRAKKAIAEAHKVGKAFPVEPMDGVEARIAAALELERAEQDRARLAKARTNWKTA